MKKSEFELWINNPDTREVIKILHGQIKNYADALVSGAYASEETMEKVAGKYIYTTAYLSGLKFVIEDIVNYLEDDENEE